MTFDEIVDRVAKRLKLTSDEAYARIGDEVNDRYRQVTGDLGIIAPRRRVTTALTAIGSRYITFENVEKIHALYDNSVSPPRMIDEIGLTEMREKSPRTGDRFEEYVVFSVEAESITLLLDSTPESQVTLTADVTLSGDDLVGDDEPAFPASYHDVLVLGAIADEWDGQEKTAMATKFEGKFEMRLADLKLHMRSSAALIIQSNKKVTRPRITSQRL